MVAKYEVIELGAQICRLLKDIYFDGFTWADASEKVAKKFTDIKKVYRNVIPNKKDIEMLQDLSNYRKHDIEDMFDHPVPEDKPKQPIDLQRDRQAEIAKNIGSWALLPVHEPIDSEKEDIDI